MPTVAQLLVQIDAMYPNAIDTTTKIMYMNMAQDDLSPYFGKIITDTTLTTVAADDEYTLPSGINDVSEIETLDIGNQATPSDRYDYTRYQVGYKDCDPVTGNSFYQVYGSTGLKAIVIYPIPSITGLPIRIRYHSKLTDLSPTSLSSSPDFDSRYHDMLALYACYMICSTGASPDTIQADRFMQAYDDALTGLWRLQMEQKSLNPSKKRDNRLWRTRR